MKRLAALLGLMLNVATVAGAQATDDRVVVPLHSTTAPRLVKARVIHGSITVKTHEGKEVIVETPSQKLTHQPTETVEGMRRIDPPARRVEIEEDNNVITIHAPSAETKTVVITVPRDTSLQLHTTHGSVTVEGVHGDVQADSTHGSLHLSGVSGTVLASFFHGSIHASLDRVDPRKPMSFTTDKGEIDVTLPDDVKLDVQMSSVSGPMYTDFEIIRTGGQPILEKNVSSGGPFRVRAGKAIYGSINGGGVKASFRAVNGSIKLRKKSSTRNR